MDTIETELGPVVVDEQGPSFASSADPVQVLAHWLRVRDAIGDQMPRACPSLLVAVTHEIVFGRVGEA